MTAVKLEAGKIVFIGAGNMAEALVGGMVGKKLCPAAQITVTDVRPERLTHFERTYGVKGCVSNEEAVRGAGVVVLAVKPQVMGGVVAGFAAAIPADALIVSIAAGVTTEKIGAMFGGKNRVVRAMPNMPAMVGSGAAGISAGANATEQDLMTAEKILGAVGIVVRVRESDLDAVTALSGSGPGYLAYLVEAMLQAARQLGLEAGVARQLVLATLEGTTKALNETGLDPAELRERVTSKGGTTFAALEVLRQGGVGEKMVEAILAAQRRSRELSS